LNIISSPSGVTTHTFAHVRRFQPPKPDKYKRGIKVRISSYRTSPYNPIAGHSTICYLPMILARRAAWDRGLDEVLVQSTDGGVTEGSTSNLFIVSNGKLITPPEDQGIQKEVARKVVLELAGEMKIPVKEKTIGVKALMAADEVFIVNSLIEVMPVREIDGAVIGNGRAGTVSKALFEAYQSKVKQELS
jgi:branched-chain amino acid aminotransferase